MSSNNITSGNLFARLMGMDDETWLRHANPLSVWTRAITGLPAILIPLWSVRWIGWLAVVPIGAGIYRVAKIT